MGVVDDLYYGKDTAGAYAETDDDGEEVPADV